MESIKTNKMTNYRWVICAMLFFATTVNYMDRQVLSLTWKDFIAPEFEWNDNDYGTITAYFSIFYAIFMLFAGKVVDWMGTKRGYLWAIGIWSTGAVLHAFCGIATSGIVTGHWLVGFEGAKEHLAAYASTAAHIGLAVSTVSVWLFLFCRIILAMGEAGNFPAAIKVTAEYFPKKDRAFATSIFNNGASVGALIAPVTIPIMARHFGWEMAFIVIGALGYIWMGFWLIIYKKPGENKHVNKAELNYIHQDDDDLEQAAKDDEGPKIGFLKCFTYRQTWAFVVGKFMTDGVLWLHLRLPHGHAAHLRALSHHDALRGRRLPAHLLRQQVGHESLRRPHARHAHIRLLPPAGYLRPAIGQLLSLVARHLDRYPGSRPPKLVGQHLLHRGRHVSQVGNSHRHGHITGIGGMAGGIGSFLINKSSGMLFTYAEQAGSAFTFAGFEGKPAGYMIIFCVCAVAYLVGWVIMKALVPRYSPITE